MPLKIIIALLSLILPAGSAFGQPSAVAAVPPDYEIEDVRNLPQDFGSGALFRPDSAPDKGCRDSFLAEFLQNYYSPWSGGAPLSDIPRSVETMKEHAGREWYGENRRKVSRKTRDELLANCDLARFPSMRKAAVALVPTAMRVLPTSRPFFDKADDFPFDKLQNAGLKLNEPVRVLHVSRDGIWAFAETADANGWVQLRDIGYIDEALAARRMGKPLLVIVKDVTIVSGGVGLAAQPARFGTLLPIMGEDKDGFVVSVAADSGSREAREVPIRLPKDVARRFPLELGRENIALVGNALIGIPYGWGELYQGRDCSALVRDFYMPFGIRLPRGSYNQITSGRRIFLSGLAPAEKERFIRDSGVPFLTLLHLKGHIMLYVGNVNGKPLIFHALWGVNVRRGDGGSVKQVVGKSIISTLAPGAELPLANGSLLDKLGSMLILTDRCAAPTPQESPAGAAALELPMDSGPDFR
jgi:hypothetical protein